MSDLHFDQDGEPNEPHASCTEIRWRYFPNPGTRGAPRIVHDKRNGGAPLYTAHDVPYLELCERVERVPGYYRGDQVDENRRVIPGTKPFYVTIAAEPRNAPGGGGTTEELLRQVVEANTRQSETVINQGAALMREQRKAMKAMRKLIRTVARPDLRDVFKRDDIAELLTRLGLGDDDDEHEDAEEAAHTDGVVKDIKDIANQVFSAFETYMLDRAAQRAEASRARASAPAAPPSSPASPPAPPPAPPVPPAATPPPVVPPPSTSSTPASSPPLAAATSSATEVRNAASPMPTPEQAAHLMAILHALNPDERTVAKLVVKRMSDEQRAQWLAELSPLSVEQAVELVRSMIPARTKKENES